MKKILIVFVLISFTLLGADEVFKARVFQQESGELLYLHYNEINENDSLIVKTHYYLHPDSSLAVLDRAFLINDKPWKFIAEFVDTDEKSLLILEDGILAINYWKNGEKKSESIEFDDKLLGGPIFNDFVEDNWNNLRKGEVEKFRLPAAAMLTTGGFYLKELSDSQYKKPGTAVFKMGVSSLFLRLLIKPSYFVYNIEQRRLIEIHGLTVLPHKENGEWSQTTNADIYFEY